MRSKSDFHFVVVIGNSMMGRFLICKQFKICMSMYIYVDVAIDTEYRHRYDMNIYLSIDINMMLISLLHGLNAGN